MDIQKINTLGALKAAGYQSKSIKNELRDNLRYKMQHNLPTFEGVYGFEDTVIPELERAILSKHNINLLGLRGQAKTRLARKMVHLLDEYIPVIAGSEINDDPLKPLSFYGKQIVSEQGDDTPIAWMHRSERFSEKLATPDVTVADLIGDVDPIKAANLKLSYAEDRVIHFGMIPRANRCIFVINELPDLQARIQVALFNILQEGDIQIRGFKLRLPLDMQFVFTANPEDYTNRGSIVTPLKDRIGSQILTHYPNSVEIAKRITAQEAQLDETQASMVFVPNLAKDLLEQIGFEARESAFVDYKSGVSARMSITAYENLISTAERRALRNHEAQTTVRLSDFMGIIPSLTGKMELVYEGEQEGADLVAVSLIEAAIKTFFPGYFPKIEKLERNADESPYAKILEWFFAETGFELLDDAKDETYKNQLNEITPLDAVIQKYQPNCLPEERYFLKEFLLWGLVAHEKLTKDRLDNGLQFRDLYGNYISKL
ncbi:MAG: magnesium chelatase [Flavobacterium sp.]